MQTRTTIALAAAFTVGMALVPMSAKAICQQMIYADYSFTDGTNTLIIGHSNISTPFTYSATTTNPVISALIFAAVAHRTPVLVIGDAQSCPTTPTTVPAPAGIQLSIGNIIQIFQYP
jgi:hypothetical protein